MNLKISAIALIAGLSLTGVAIAQDAPAGGPTAKGNAPLKNTHTVNDGAAKTGANSFTENEARKHIMNSGYGSVSGLAKGKDGVWRGTATRGDTTYNVALDFKGNVTDGGAVAKPMMGDKSMSPTTTTTASPAMAPAAGAAAGAAAAMTTKSTMSHHRHWMHHHHRRHHMKPCHVKGAACSGADKNHDGIADKDEHKTT